ncbi:MAG: thiamine pyrophosphate-dependent dehydrogenase E1 component subunit alpha [Pseudomonadales bacterium]|nr:thiamine pyrophosphate-dependent dehydrogenase E1 component subunit alpha [Pseudomonadales bacterium]
MLAAKKKPAAKKTPAKKKAAPKAKKAAAKAKKAPAKKAPARKAKGPSEKTLKELHLKMVRIRRFEESAGKMMEDGKIPGALHLYVGQEAVAAGVMQHLSNQDWITSTHRGHGHLVAKGGEFKPMFAELFGRATGYCKGKGGSMHISSMDLGMLGANGIVGGGPPIAMGAAFSNKFRRNKNVAVAFFGDGASNEGSVHEAANMAALYKLPCIFVCENNGYGEYTAQSRHQAIVDVADRAAGYGMPGMICDGMDVMAVYEAAGEAIERARKGGGPTLLECKTYRYYDHVGVRGMGLNYRTDEEIEAWKKKDAIEGFEKRLKQLGVMTEKQIKTVHAAVEKDVDEAIEFANESPYPEADTLLDNVYNEKGA